MLLELGVVLLSIIPSLLFGRIIADFLGQYGWRAVPFQCAFGLLIGLLASNFISYVLIVVSATAILPFIINLVGWLYQIMQRRRALDGSYGESAKWAAELVDGGDEEFEFAINKLSDDELLEIGIIANDKDELRELTIQRLEESESMTIDNFLQ
jgi:hypothetical protein